MTRLDDGGHVIGPYQQLQLELHGNAVTVTRGHARSRMVEDQGNLVFGRPVGLQPDCFRLTDATGKILGVFPIHLR
jgi:hypothetical protein